MKSNIVQGSLGVITGAASGIGRALALEMAMRGANLALADQDEKGLRAIFALLKKFPIRVTIHTLDVSNQKEMQKFSKNVYKQHGPVTFLFNNAGRALFGMIKEVSISDIEVIMNINYWGVVYGIKFFLEYMQKQRPAYIINMSSVFGLYAPPGQAAYSSSKFALRGFSEALSNELRGSNIHVSIVHPSGVDTNIVKSSIVGKAASFSDYCKLRDVFSTLPLSSSEKVARDIIDKVLKGKKRIFTGPFAKRMDLIQRTLPVSCWSIFEKFLPKK